MERNEKITVLLVDDHEMMRQGLCKIVNDQKDMVVIGEASDGKQAVELCRAISPDIIIMDVSMPVMNGIEATRLIKSQLPNARIIGLSFNGSTAIIHNMINAGATAFLKKDEAFEILCKTIRAEASASGE